MCSMEKVDRHIYGCHLFFLTFLNILLKSVTMKFLLPGVKARRSVCCGRVTDFDFFLNILPQNYVPVDM